MKKILFTEPNRMATVEERKTNTRRIMNPQPSNCFGKIRKDFCIDKSEFCDNNCCIKQKPRYKVGETVYVPEPYRMTRIDNTWYVNYKDKEKREVLISNGNKQLQKIIIQQQKSKSGFCNKMFMPEWAARTFIKITDVKRARLQDISDADCFREGIYDDGTGYVYEHNGIAYSTPREAYAAEIDIINGKGTWDSNPFVWSYYYELIKNK